jgi:nickel-type superoxide dismutase maturation protease
VREIIWYRLVHAAVQGHLTQVRQGANPADRDSAPPAVGAMVKAARLGAAVGVASAVVAWGWLHRVEVVGSSMSPALQPGDRLLVLGPPRVPDAWVRPGAVVAVSDPRHPERTLIKRVSTVDRRAGTLEVLGDAGEASTDSREFGPVPRASIRGLAVYRYAPPDRKGPAPWPEEYHQA